MDVGIEAYMRMREQGMSSSEARRRASSAKAADQFAKMDAYKRLRERGLTSASARSSLTACSTRQSLVVSSPDVLASQLSFFRAAVGALPSRPAGGTEAAWQSERQRRRQQQQQQEEEE